MNEPIPPPHLIPPLPPGSSRDPAIQAALDTEHLRLLAIAYYIAGAITALASCFFIFHTLLFLTFGLHPQLFRHAGNPDAHAPRAAVFLVLAMIFGSLIVLGWCFGALQIYAGRCLKNRKHPIFIQIVAAVECIFVPWGTAIGVATFFVLNHPTVAALFTPPPPKT